MFYRAGNISCVELSLDFDCPISFFEFMINVQDFLAEVVVLPDGDYDSADLQDQELREIKERLQQ